MPIEIETKRLILREYREDDWSDVHEYSKLPEVTKFMTWGPNTEDQTKQFISLMVSKNIDLARDSYEFAAVLKETGRVIGGIGMRIKSESLKTADMGYCYSPEVWGKGVGTEAAAAMLKLGFETLGLHRIWAVCDTENAGSEAIMRKNGMTKEGQFRKDQLIKGEWRDSHFYAILEDEWRRLAAQPEIVIRNSR